MKIIRMDDWFFNSGIAGFLYLYFKGGPLKNTKHVRIYDNYIEVDEDVLVESVNSAMEALFIYDFPLGMGMYLQGQKSRLESSNKELSEKTFKDYKERIKKDNSYYGILKIIYTNLTSIESEKELLEEIGKILKDINNDKKIKSIFKKLRTSSGIFSLSMADGYLYQRFGKNFLFLNKFDGNINKHTNGSGVCSRCHEKSDNIIIRQKGSSLVGGTNLDNTNWMWFGNPKSMGICVHCYAIEVLSIFSYIMVENDFRKKQLIFMHKNYDIETLYSNVVSFKDSYKEEVHGSRGVMLYGVWKRYIKELEKKYKIKACRQRCTLYEITDLSGKQDTTIDIGSYHINGKAAQLLYEFEIDKIKWRIKSKITEMRGGKKVQTTITIGVADFLFRKTLNNSLSINDAVVLFKEYYNDSSIFKYNGTGFLSYIVKYYITFRGKEQEANMMLEMSKRLKNCGHVARKILENMGRSGTISGFCNDIINAVICRDSIKINSILIKISQTTGMDSSIISPETIVNKDDACIAALSFLSGFAQTIKDKKEDK